MLKVIRNRPINTLSENDGDMPGSNDLFNVYNA